MLRYVCLSYSFCGKIIQDGTSLCLDVLNYVSELCNKLGMIIIYAPTSRESVGEQKFVLNRSFKISRVLLSKFVWGCDLASSSK